MTKRKALVLFLLLVACIAIGGLIVTTSKHREPTYNGKTLSEWLTQSPSDIDSTQDVHAVQQIGTNALPFLLQWIQSPPSARQIRLSRLLSRFHLNPYENKMTRPEIALGGFLILGEKAKPAIPALALLAESSNSLTQSCAFRALGAIGKDALPVLLDLLTNSPAHPNCYKPNLALAFWDLNTNAFLAKPVMLAHIRDPDPQVASAAIHLLGILGEIQEANELPPDCTADIVPALGANLENTNTALLLDTIRALRYFQSNARPDVPVLLQKLTSTNQEIRAAAASVLKLIDPQALERAQKP